MDSEAPAAVERRSPEAAFGLLANDLRVAMLRALGEADGPVSFSALRERVGERDSGKFNYHLGKLVGQFVTRGEDGYALSLAGQQVYGAILAGTYTADAAVEPFAFDAACPLCGHDVLLAEYVDERAKLYCPDCGVWRNEFSFPPANLDEYARADLPAAFDAWMRATVLKVLGGFCANCGGPSAGRVEAAGDESPLALAVVFECGRCGDELRSAPTLPVIFDPAGVSFFAAHGVDVFADPSWTFLDPAWTVDVEQSDDAGDGASVTVRLAVGDDELVATLGPDVTVRDVRVS